MKKLLFLIVAASTGFAAQAQQSSFGPSIGLNYAWLSDLDNTSGRPSYNLGVTYTHSIIENAGLGIDLRYSEEGSKQEVTGVELTTKLNYVRVPIKFIYFFGQLEKDFRPKLFAGPTMGFLIGGKSQLRSETGTTEVDSKDYYESVDLGLNFGTGFNYRLAEAMWLNFGVAYTHGFVNVVKSGPEAFNRNVNVNLGIAWGF
jgi:hypothetical protein